VIFLVTDANRARRRRRQTVLNSGQAANPNPQTDARQLPLNLQGQQQQQRQQQPQQQFSQGGIGMQKDMNVGQNQGGRQYYPYSGVGTGGQYGIQSCI
jgi:hypothetical protein